MEGLLPASPPSLFSMAMGSILSHVSMGGEHLAQIGALSCLPHAAAAELLRALCERLAKSLPACENLPPVCLLRLFYGTRIERLSFRGASDDWLSEIAGSLALPDLRALHLVEHARCTPYGACQLALSLRNLSVLRICHCKTLGSAGLLELTRLTGLRSLGLPECEIVLSPQHGAAIAGFSALSELDLSGNTLQRGALDELCALQSLSTLRLWRCDLSDESAATLMTAAQLAVLDLGWSSITCEGFQCIVLGFPWLTSLSLARCRLQSGDAAACVPLLAALSAAVR